MDVHLRELRYFVAVAEEGNFGRAAARLHITQPTLSQQIAKLERQMRTPLLERDHRGVRVTPAGARLLAASRELLKDWQVAEAAVTQLSTGQRLRIDVWSEHQGWPEILSDIAAANPALQPEISMRRGTPAAAEALRREEIDLAIGMVTGLTLGAGLHSTPVRIRQLCLAVSSRHRFASRDAVSCVDLAGARIWMPSNMPGEIERLFRCLITRFAAVPVDAGPTLGLSQALETVGRDPDLATMHVLGTNIPADADARLLPLTDPEPCLRSSLIWRSSDSNPRLAALLRILTKLAAEEGWLSFDSERQWLLGTNTLTWASSRSDIEDEAGNEARRRVLAHGGALGRSGSSCPAARGGVRCEYRGAEERPVRGVSGTRSSVPSSDPACSGLFFPIVTAPGSPAPAAPATSIMTKRVTSEHSATTGSATGPLTKQSRHPGQKPVTVHKRRGVEGMLEWFVSPSGHIPCTHGWVGSCSPGRRAISDPASVDVAPSACFSVTSVFAGLHSAQRG